MLVLGEMILLFVAMVRARGSVVMVAGLDDSAVDNDDAEIDVMAAAADDVSEEHIEMGKLSWRTLAAGEVERPVVFSGK